MPHIGTLKTWHDDRGFGFIAPSDGGRELFVHISSFPRDGFRPTVGESLWFEVGPGKDGKEQAIRIRRRATGDRSAYPRRRTVKSGSKRSVIAALVIVALGAFGYSMYQQAERPTVEPQSASPAESTVPAPQASAPKPTRTRSRQLASEPAVESTTPIPQVSAPYRCDGRTRCSEMTSCAEATFFLNNCPGTQMDGDGDGDGVPCEQQWCG